MSKKIGSKKPKTRDRKKPIKIDRSAIYDAVSLGATLGISRRSVTRMVQGGKLSDNKIGTKYFWSGKDVLNSLSSIAPSTN